MSIPAIRKVQNALVTLIETARPTLNVFVDRDDDEPLQENELPGIVIRFLDDQFDYMQEYGASTKHTVAIQIDCHSGGNVSDTIDMVNQQTISDIIAAIGANRTLGNRLHELEEQSATGSEQVAVTGCAILSLQAIYFTPRGDFYTIIGHAGQTF
jgi:hypothetical protein